jgi:4-amino-4-deoxy-L-arabinose transferase-like glycosyltransferase
MSRRTYRLAVAGILLGDAVLLVWNAFRFDWLRGYDAFANDLYAAVVGYEHRLPSEAESGSWHSPPLWFALAGTLRRAADALGLEHVQRPGQLLAALAGFATCVLVLLIARELWPERRGLQIVALVVAAASPALVRASAMYHPETLAVALAAAGTFVGIRGLRRGPTLRTGIGAGALLGLAALTRGWALPVLVAVIAVAALDARRKGARAPAIAMASVSLALLAPWLVNQQAFHGDALAFNRPPPHEPLLSRRPAGFYLGLRMPRAFDRPVTPLFRNELVPHLYADWWGDWALTWDAPPPPAPGELLPAHVVADRARQSVLGVLPTLLGLAGIAALAVLAVARRSAALGVLPLSALATGAAYLLFTIRYPSTDGDTIKATYLLMALPAAAVGAAFVADELRPRGRAWTIALGAALAAFVAAQLPFLVL